MAEPMSGFAEKSQCLHMWRDRVRGVLRYAMETAVPTGGDGEPAAICQISVEMIKLLLEDCPDA